MFSASPSIPAAFGANTKAEFNEKAALAQLSERIAQERLRRPLSGISLVANQQLVTHFQQRAEQFRSAALQGR